MPSVTTTREAGDGFDADVLLLVFTPMVLDVVLDVTGYAVPSAVELALSAGPLLVAAGLLATRDRRFAAVGFGLLALGFGYLTVVDLYGNTAALVGFFAIVVVGFCLVVYDVVVPFLGGD